MAQVSRVYRDPLYADELAGKAPERARIHRRHGFLASGGGGGDEGDDEDERERGAPHQQQRHHPHHRTPRSVRRLANPDPRGVLRAINEYELMRACGGWWQMTGEHPDIAVLARIQLVMAGIADAERRTQEEAGDEHGSGMSSPSPVPGGRSEHRETVSTARSAWTKKQPVYPRPDPLAG